MTCIRQTPWGRTLNGIPIEPRVKPAPHQAIERRVSGFTIDHVYPEIVKLELDNTMHQFDLPERVKKLKPGQSITMHITRSSEHIWGDYIAIRIEDAFTGHKK